MNRGSFLIASGCSAAFGNIILKACAYERRDRYHSIDEMIRDLERLEKVPVRPYKQHKGRNGKAAEAARKNAAKKAQQNPAL